MTRPSTPAVPATAPPTGGAPRSAARRRLLMWAAGAGLPWAAWRAGRGGSPQALHWQGTALGAPASVQLHHADPARAQAALAAMQAELARLESVFSLYRADSVLSRLNASGRLDAAPADFISLLRAALAMAERSQGLFDPTVQPLWQLYHGHFGVQGQAGPPAPALLAAALARVGWQRVQVQGARVVLGAPGMALTLNGIAQGCITDRCGDVLRAHGFDRVLVDMGELRVGAPKPDGSAWRVGLADPRDPSRALHTVVLQQQQAVATSGGYGTRLDAAGRVTHLIDPRSGRTAPALESVSVTAPTAQLADALSTTLALVPREQTARRLALLQAHPGCQAVTIDAEGRVQTLAAADAAAALPVQGAPA